MDTLDQFTHSQSTCHRLPAGSYSFLCCKDTPTLFHSASKSHIIAGSVVFKGILVLPMDNIRSTCLLPLLLTAFRTIYEIYLLNLVSTGLLGVTDKFRAYDTQ